MPGSPSRTVPDQVLDATGHAGWRRSCPAVDEHAFVEAVQRASARRTAEAGHPHLAAVEAGRRPLDAGQRGRGP